MPQCIEIKPYLILYTYIFPVTYGNMTLLAFLEAMALVEGVNIYMCVCIEFMAILDVSGVKETS